MDAEKDTSRTKSLIVSQGGLFGQLMAKVGLGGCSRVQVLRRTLFWVAITWLPPILLNVLGRLFTSEVPRFEILVDLSFHVRCLVSIPLLLATECKLQLQFARVLPAVESRQFFRFEKARAIRESFLQCRRLQQSRLVDPILVLCALVMVSTRLYIDLPPESSATSSPEPILYVLSQEWNRWISFVFYYFLAFRWIWRFVVWGWFLFRMALLDPNLKSLHPDKVGGLGFLLYFHKLFGVASFGISSVASANIATVVLRGRLNVDDFLNPLILYLFLFNTMLALPLLSFTPVLIKARIMGLVRYGRMANTYAANFDRKWLSSNDRTTKQVLGTPDIQSLNDLHGSFGAQAQMRIFLLDSRTLFANSFFILAPLLPLVLFKIRAFELVNMVVRHFFKL